MCKVVFVEESLIVLVSFIILFFELVDFLLLLIQYRLECLLFFLELLLLDGVDIKDMVVELELLENIEDVSIFEFR